jgi:hypothetical protein
VKENVLGRISAGKTQGLEVDRISSASSSIPRTIELAWKFKGISIDASIQELQLWENSDCSRYEGKSSMYANRTIALSYTTPSRYKYNNKICSSPQE